MTAPAKIVRGLVIRKEWRSEKERTWGEIPIGHGMGDPDGTLRSAIFVGAGFEEGDRVALVLEQKIGVVRVCNLCDQSWPCPAGLDGVEGHRSTERPCPPPPSPGPVLPGSIAASSLQPVERLFLAVYDPGNGMAELINVGVVSAPDAKAARTKAAALFQTTAGYKIDITPLSELADGWSYYR